MIKLDCVDVENHYGTIYIDLLKFSDLYIWMSSEFFFKGPRIKILNV